MQFIETGNPFGKTLMLLPGTGCTWEMNFQPILEDLKEDFHLILVNYDGFCDNPEETFPGMEAVTEKIEDYVKRILTQSSMASMAPL